MKKTFSPLAVKPTMHLYEADIKCRMEVVGRDDADALDALQHWLTVNTGGKFQIENFHRKAKDAWKEAEEKKD